MRGTHLLTLAILLAGVVAGLDCLAKVLLGSLQDWNLIRFTAPAAILQGISVYPRHGEGPLISGVNMPFAVLVYLPAALFLPHAWSVNLATLTSLALFVGPWAIMAGTRLRQLAPALLFALFVLVMPALTSSAFSVHADAPGAGFAGIATMLIYRRKHLEGPLWMGLTALCATASWMSKVTFLPVPVALICAVFLFDGFRAARQFVVALVGTTLALFAVAALVSDLPGIYENNFARSFQHRWILHPSDFNSGFAVTPAQRASAIVSTLTEILTKHYFIYLVALASIFTLPPRIAEWRERRNLVPLILACALLPTSILGRVKFGGAINTLTPTVYFMAMAAALALARGFESLGEKGEAIFAALLVTFALLVVPDTMGSWQTLRHSGGDRLTPAVEIAKRYPGAVYFPYLPLATLVVDHRLDHSLLLVAEHETEGSPISTAQFRRFLPPHLKIVAVEGMFPDLAHFFPSARLRANDPGLPGWQLYDVD